MPWYTTNRSHGAGETFLTGFAKVTANAEKTSTNELVLTKGQYRRIQDWLYQVSGIDLKVGKENLVKNRLAKRIRTLGLSNFNAYIRYVEQDKSRKELLTLIDSMTTNKTSFFRERVHFDYIANQLIPDWSQRRDIRIWSAGCSSGEEPYSLSMLLFDKYAAASSTRILATDISDSILEQARTGIYRADQVVDLPTHYKTAYMQKKNGEHYSVKPDVRSTIRFANLNLMANWPMKGPFDLILCRNVMIYFDRQTQERLINRYYELLRPGGHLFIGHSESLASVNHPFSYCQPAVYKRD